MLRTIYFKDYVYFNILIHTRITENSKEKEEIWNNKVYQLKVKQSGKFLAQSKNIWYVFIVYHL